MKILFKGAISYFGTLLTSNNSFVVSDCIFENCSANKKGGAIYIKETYNECATKIDLIISNNSFNNCSSQNYGSIVYLDVQCKNLLIENNRFENNKIDSGYNVSSSPFNITMTSSPIFYNQILNDFDFTVYDIFNQQCIFPSYELPRLTLTSIPNPSTLFFSKTELFMENGIVEFPLKHLEGTQNKQYQINATFSPVSPELLSIQNNFSLINAGCPLGFTIEFFSCSSCKDNQYSLGNGCLSCPRGKTCSSKLVEDHSITFQNNFWILPNSTNPQVIIACSKYSNCVKFSCKMNCSDVCLPVCSQVESGVYKTEIIDYGYGFCELGYEGFLCSKCSKGYYISEDRCVNCVVTKKWQFILFCLLSSVFLILILFAKHSFIFPLLQVILFTVFLYLGVANQWTIEIITLAMIFLVLIEKKSSLSAGTAGK